MKIVHICLSGYIDGWGYQENLLPAYQAKAGHDVYVITSSNHFPVSIDNFKKKEIEQKGLDYIFEDVRILRIRTYINKNSLSLFGLSLYEILKSVKPDVIFHHNVMLPSLFFAVLYKFTNKSTHIVVDNHADKINQTKKKIWFVLYYRLITRSLLKLLTPYIVKYYGVTPARCDYLNSVYGVPFKKIDLLPIGGDKELVNSIEDNLVHLKTKHNLPVDSKIIISGGKMGRNKGTISLIEAFKSINNDDHSVLLVLFGSFLDEDTRLIAQSTSGVYIYGWCDRRNSLELLKLSHVACWPVHHTTLIEDAISCSVPIVIRKTNNTIHLVKGNGLFVENGDTKELKIALKNIINEKEYNHFKIKAKELSCQYSYDRIARKVINDIFDNHEVQ